jgi:hypothetical protein
VHQAKMTILNQTKIMILHQTNIIILNNLKSVILQQPQYFILHQLGAGAKGKVKSIQLYQIISLNFWLKHFLAVHILKPTDKHVNINLFFFQSIYPL